MSQLLAVQCSGLHSATIEDDILKVRVVDFRPDLLCTRLLSEQNWHRLSSEHLIHKYAKPEIVTVSDGWLIRELNLRIDVSLRIVRLLLQNFGCYESHSTDYCQRLGTFVEYSNGAKVRYLGSLLVVVKLVSKR